MSQYFITSYFHFLPNELILKILENVATYDAINFTEAYECDYFLGDRQVTRTINLCRQYALRDLKYLSSKIVFNNVTTLDINGLYWIPGADLRKFVAKMSNLENLYAVDTKLDMTTKDVAAYSATNIKKLAITVKTVEFSDKKIESLRTLYINIVSKDNLRLIEKIFCKLSKLWVEAENFTQGIYRINPLEKLVYKVKFGIHSICYTKMDLYCYYHTIRCGQPYLSCFAQSYPIKLHEDEIIAAKLADPAWKILHELHCSEPYGPNDAQDLYSNQISWEDMRFQELNFNHGPVSCSDRYVEAASQILSSKSAQSIKKLSISMCLLECRSCDLERADRKENVDFKRRRLASRDQKCSHTEEYFLKNCPNVEQLEIFICNRPTSRSVVQTYHLLTSLKQLKKLTVELPIFIDANFLISVLKQCKKLEVLRIKSLQLNDNLNFILYQAIHAGTSLRDFRYESKHVQLDRLMESLCLISTRNLQRVAIICATIDKFSANPLRTFLNLNPQLIFLYFDIQQGTKEFAKSVQSTLNDFQKEHPAKVFFIKRTTVKLNRGFPIPDVHYFEMVECESDICNLNVREDYVDF